MAQATQKKARLCIGELYKEFPLGGCRSEPPYSGRNHHKQQADSQSPRDSETNGKE